MILVRDLEDMSEEMSSRREVEMQVANRFGKFGHIHVRLGRRTTTVEVLKKCEKEWKVAHKKIMECCKVSFDFVFMSPCCFWIRRKIMNKS